MYKVYYVSDACDHNPVWNIDCMFLLQLSVNHTILKLGDFGLARATEGTRQTKTQIGSYRYMAPEVVSSGGRYSKKADVHSYGESMAIVTIPGNETENGVSCMFHLFLFLLLLLCCCRHCCCFC